MGLMDPLYDTYVPIFLGKYISSMSLVGIIMTLDNALAIFLIPIFSALSDKTETRIGRRMPYIITCLPLTAIFFALIPLSALQSFWLLIVCIFFLNIFKQAVRGPVVALMPDLVPADLRSEANGVINTMGGIATILGTVLLARLMDVYIPLRKGGEKVNNVLAFPVASLFVLIAVILLFIFVKEKKSTNSDSEEEKKEPLLKSIKAIFIEKEKSALFILLSLFCWFMAYQGILPFVGQYSVTVLRTSSGTASLAAGMVGIAYAIFAVPTGKVATKFGRKKTIRISLLALVVVLILVTVHGFVLTEYYPNAKTPVEMLEPNEFGGEVKVLQSEKGMNYQEELKLEEKKPASFFLYSFWALLFLFGIFWVSVVTNSFPMLWQMADYQTMGIYTGVYYFFSQLSSICAPPLAGAVIDLAGYPALFLYGAVFMLVAFFLMSKVNRGEVSDKSLD